jgi:hypothetical protein
LIKSSIFAHECYTIVDTCWKQMLSRFHKSWGTA